MSKALLVIDMQEAYVGGAVRVVLKIRQARIAKGCE